MAWRPYVISNKYGQRQAMRYTKVYPTKDKAIKAIKKGNNEWISLNYNSDFAKKANFEYGAVNVKGKNYKFKKGMEGNKKLLKYHDSLKKTPSNLMFEFDFGGSEFKKSKKKNQNIFDFGSFY